MSLKKVLRAPIVMILIVCMLTALTFAAAPQKVSPTGNDTFLIGVFWPPLAAYTNSQQYGWLSEAKINHVLNVTTNDLQAIQTNKDILNLCAANGLKFTACDLRYPASNSTIDAWVTDYGSYSALLGYYIKDEPSINELSTYASQYNYCLSKAPDSIPYVNLLPSYAGTSLIGSNGIKAYFTAWVDAVGYDAYGNSKLKYLTFDNYPFVNGSIEPTYFGDLEAMRQVGIEKNVKTSCFLQGCGFIDVYRTPTSSEMKWNVYTALAYGMKGLYWFTWQSVTTAQNSGFTSNDAVIHWDGSQNTSVFNTVKGLDTEVYNLGSTLMKLTSQNVYNAGTLPSGTFAIPANFFWQPTTTYNQIVSHFLDKSTNRSYIMVVNRDYVNSRTLSFNLSSKPSAVTEISKANGTEISTNYNNSTGNISATFAPGEGKLYAVSTDYIYIPDLALNKTVTASSCVDNWGWTKPNVVDGLRTTTTSSAGWSSNNSTSVNHTEWVTVDLGTSKTIDKVDLYPRSDSCLYFPIDFTIQLSEDNINWTTARTVTNYPQPTNTVQSFTLSSPENAQYVKVECTNLRPYGGLYYAQFAEIEIYNTSGVTLPPPPTNLALSRTVAASSSVENWGFYLTKAVDGQRSSVPDSYGWSSNNSTSVNHTEWVTVDMGTNNTISKVDLYPRNDGVNTGYGFPINFAIKVSTDNANWATVLTQTGYALPSGVVQSFTFNSQNARYVKVEGTSLRPNPNDSNLYRMQFAEMEVYN